MNDGVNPAVTLPRIRLVTGMYSFRTGSVDGAAGGNISSKVAIGPGSSSAGANAFAAGEGNIASGNWSTIPGGIGNIADDTGSTVSGGGNNRARGKFAIVAGGGGTNPIDSNSASATHSTVSGGSRNIASNQSATVGGGFNNRSTNNSATISGGAGNLASGSGATIGGGLSNTAEGSYSTIGGGRKNYALGDHSTIAGGGGSSAADSNLALGNGSAIGGGSRHVATGRLSVIGGGHHNHTGGAFAAISGGGGPFPSDSNVANGFCAAVPGGTRNWANGNYSLAAGRRAQALHGGTFVWGDSTDADFVSTTANTFVIRATNGVGVGTANPEAPLHVFEASAGAVTAHANASAAFERDTHNYLNILAPDNSERGILFGSPLNAASGGIIFDPVGLDNGMHFRTNTNDTRMTLDASGNLTVVGCVDGNNTACASDLRFKKNVCDVEAPIAIVQKLRGVSYDWNREDFPDQSFEDGRHYGVIAQELERVLPGLVRTRSNGYKSVEYNGLIPILIEAIKEQQDQIDQLKKKLEQ